MEPEPQRRSRIAMNPELRNVHTRIRALGLDALAHANWHAHYMHMNDSTSALSALQAAHAAELLIKARIAEEHPLLIFDQIPKASESESGLLSFHDLFSRGRTLDYADLPSRLWAATGIALPGLERFKEFGKLRNAIQHFASPPVDVAVEVTKFIYGVIDPLINNCWGDFAIDYNEDTEPHLYLMESLMGREVDFLVSPEAAACWDDCLAGIKQNQPKVSRSYLARMKKRVKAAARAVTP